MRNRVPLWSISANILPTFIVTINMWATMLTRIWDIRVCAIRVNVTDWVVLTERIQVQPAIQPDGVLRQPTARRRIVPPGAEVDKASRRRPFAALEAVAVSDERRNRGCRRKDVAPGIVCEAGNYIVCGIVHLRRAWTARLHDHA